MRLLLVTVLLATACSPHRETMPIPQSEPPRRVTRPNNDVAAPAEPSAPAMTERPAVGEEGHRLARDALGQAFAAYRAGDLETARDAVRRALLAMDRRLPEDQTSDRPTSLLRAMSVSEDGKRLLVADPRTLLLADGGNGQILGIALHATAEAPVPPALSPKGEFVAATAADGVVVYDAATLGERVRIAARPFAPFAFLDDAHLITVRFGPEAIYVPRPRPQEPAQGLGAPGELTRDLPQSKVILPAATDVELPELQRDDELVVVEIATGKVTASLKLTMPTALGPLRRVTSLPPSEACLRNGDCDRFAFDPAPIGRRVVSLDRQGEFVATSWQGGAVSLHRARGGQLIGAFRSRGERWKPALVALLEKPALAAVVTALPEVGRGTDPALSVVALVDLKQYKRSLLLDDCRWATGLGFSLDGRRLAVGDLRKAFMYDVKTGQRLATTDEIRQSFGPSDEQEDVAVHALSHGRFLLRSQDGAYGIFDWEQAKLQVKGRFAEPLVLVADGAKALYVTHRGSDAAELVTVDANGVQRRPLRTAELEGSELPVELVDTAEGQRAARAFGLAAATCVVEGYRLPRELCRESTSGRVTGSPSAQ